MKIFSFFNRRLLIIELTKLTEQQRPNLMLPTLLEKQHDHTLLGFFATSHVHNRLVLCCIPARSSAPSKNNKGYHQELKFNLWWILPWGWVCYCYHDKVSSQGANESKWENKTFTGMKLNISCLLHHSEVKKLTSLHVNAPIHTFKHACIHASQTSKMNSLR